MPEWRTPFEEIEIGKGRKLKDGKDIAILIVWPSGQFCCRAISDLRAEGITPAHYDMRFVKPFDEELLHEVFAITTKIIRLKMAPLWVVLALLL